MPLRGGFAHYRAFGVNAEQVARAAGGPTSGTPTLDVGGNVVGDALYRQLLPITQQLEGRLLEACGHIIPEDQPAELARLIERFVAAGADDRAGH
jgi:hypothetical protein